MYTKHLLSPFTLFSIATLFSLACLVFISPKALRSTLRQSSMERLENRIIHLLKQISSNSLKSPLAVLFSLLITLYSMMINRLLTSINFSFLKPPHWLTDFLGDLSSLEYDKTLQRMLLRPSFWSKIIQHADSILPLLADTRPQTVMFLKYCVNPLLQKALPAGIMSQQPEVPVSALNHVIKRIKENKQVDQYAQLIARITQSRPLRQEDMKLLVQASIELISHAHDHELSDLLATQISDLSVASSTNNIRNTIPVYAQAHTMPTAPSMSEEDLIHKIESLIQNPVRSTGFSLLRTFATALNNYVSNQTRPTSPANTHGTPVEQNDHDSHQGPLAQLFTLPIKLFSTLASPFENMIKPLKDDFLVNFEHYSSRPSFWKKVLDRRDLIVSLGDKIVWLVSLMGNNDISQNNVGRLISLLVKLLTNDKIRECDREILSRLLAEIVPSQLAQLSGNQPKSVCFFNSLEQVKQLCASLTHMLHTNKVLLMEDTNISLMADLLHQTIGQDATHHTTSPSGYEYEPATRFANPSVPVRRDDLHEPFAPPESYRSALGARH